MAPLAFAAPASAGSVPGWIANHTGRHLGGARLGHGSHKCKVWNKDGNRTYKPATFSCEKVTVQPHTTTANLDDMDAVTVFSSGYYYIRWATSFNKYTGYTYTSYHKAHAGVYTRFHSLHTAHCYSGTHVHCTVY
jgi:hypothetical protein